MNPSALGYSRTACRPEELPRDHSGRDFRTHPPPPSGGLGRRRLGRRRHGPRAGGRRRPEGRQRPPRHRDEPGAVGLHALPARDDARPVRRALAGPRPLRAVLRPQQPDALHPAVPRRFRARARRHRVTAHLEVEDARTPGVPPHQGRRDHHRPAGPGSGIGGRHGDGGPLRARPLRPRCGARHQPVRPLHLRDRLRRRHRGGRHQRGELAGGHPAARAT